MSGDADNFDEPEQDDVSGIGGSEPGDGEPGESEPGDAGAGESDEHAPEESAEAGDAGEATDPTASTFGLPPKRGTKPSGDPDDILFQSGAPGDAEEEFGTRDQFKEGKPGKWAGHALSADEIGIPVESKPGYLTGDDDFGLDSEQELQLVDDESQLENADTGAAASDDEVVLDDAEPLPEAAAAQGNEDTGLGDEFFVLDENEGEGQDGDGSGTMLADEPLPVDNYPVEEGWEPVAGGAGTEEPWLEQEPAAASVGEDTENLQLVGSHAEGEGLEEQYYEEAGPEVVAGAPRAHGRLLRFMVSAAAAVMVVGAGAVVVLRPEWLGLHFEPQLVERVQVARPEIAGRVPTPPRPLVATPVVPPVQVGHTTPPVSTDPLPTKDPVATGPIETGPIEPTPGPGETGPVATGPDTHRTNSPSQLPEYLPVGENLWIGTFDGGERAVPDWAPVRLGAKAFAQLHNGNFFIGSVKAVAKDALILTVPTGEITLAREEVQRVTTLDSGEYAELQQATTGFLKLSNSNRLVGAILKSVVDDNYVLQIRSDRIVVPRSAVERVVEQPGVDGLRFGTARDEEEWLRQIAARELRAMSTGAPVPGPEVRQRAPANKPLPVKQVGKQAPGTTKTPPKAPPKKPTPKK